MKKLKELLKKYKEFILYIVYGLITTAVNYGVYALCLYLLPLAHGIPEKMVASISNIIAWILAVLVAYITNKLWVFKSRSWKIKIVLKELGEFVLGRVLTGILETAAIAFFVDYLGLNKFVWKIITSIVVVILNYIISKLIVFRKKKKSENKDGEDL